MLHLQNTFSSFSVDQLEEAHRFYTEVLGFEVIYNTMGLLELQIANSNPILIYPKTNHSPATFTILNFPVDNIDRAVAELSARGVTFENYNDGSIQTDQNHILRGGELDIAWFKDPAGNILSILQNKNV
ncbi:VOC family protein [Paradesertivirga mongoliensis]|uniref:VOC family protein n=1 Tax=Paradesertivirga mongoliensis TaxID=2100740 RepID=A0ABW4ZN62_9SPHI|nr:VOC family protein [Pedobacter mongoliensis]